MRKVYDWEENINLISSIFAGYESDLSKSLVNMVLLFNCFESKTQWYNYSKFYKIDKKYYIDTFEQFRNRYITDGQINNKFDNLFRNNHRYNNSQLSNNYEVDNKKHVEETLLGIKCQDDDKLRTCLIIAYRFRNNIFHGKKHICELENYLDCYKIIIELFYNILKYSTYK